MKKSVCFLKSEIVLWCLSTVSILLSFIFFDRENILTLIASLIGVTSLIFNAKGLPFGQFLMILFSILYGIISWEAAYYGEMITYLGMTAPMALVALIAWLRNPYDDKSREVRVNALSKKEYVFMSVLTLLVTSVFYFILKAFGTANLLVSTLSVTTSFAAVYLTFRRSPFFALAYAANDLVLIVLWVAASLTDQSCLSVVICFMMFLLNDLYGFYSWRRMQKRQIREV